MPSSSARVTDDDIQAWWEFYVGCRSVAQTAQHFGVSAPTVRRYLDWLGVFEETPPKRAPRGEGPVSEVTRRMVARIMSGDWDEPEKAIAAALRRINRADPDSPIYEQRLPYARALPHVKPGVHHAFVMSARQRANDAYATAAWRKSVRGEMAAAGLMTGVRPTGPRYFS